MFLLKSKAHKNLSRELRVLNTKPRQPKPDWLRIRLGDPTNQNHLLKLIQGLNLHTVCQEARCPNIFECWTNRTATFMLGGDICTRHCGFCAVGKGAPGALDTDEPRHVAEAVKHLNLAHTVITSVNRDDLPDGGAAHWAATIREVRAMNLECKIEVLIPDFNGDEDALNTVLDARPDVLNHNTETVPRLYRAVRSGARYERTLKLLEKAKQIAPSMVTKSGVMVGIGESMEELIETFFDLGSHHVDILTVGQYLRPSRDHLPIARFYTPDEFAYLKREALKFGFRHVESGPLVRSSYHAHEHVEASERAAASEPVI